MVELVVTFTILAILAGVGALAVVQYRAGADVRVAQTNVSLIAAGEQAAFLTRRAYLTFDDPQLPAVAPSTDRALAFVSGNTDPAKNQVSVAVSADGLAFAVTASTGDGRCIVASSRSGVPARTGTSEATACAAVNALLQ